MWIIPTWKIEHVSAQMQSLPPNQFFQKHPETLVFRTGSVHFCDPYGEKHQRSEGWDGISGLFSAQAAGETGFAKRACLPVCKKGPAGRNSVSPEKGGPSRVVLGTIFVHVGLVQKYHQLHAMPFASHLYLDSWDRQIASKALLPFRVKPPDVSDVCGASSKRGESREDRPIVRLDARD